MEYLYDFGDGWKHIITIQSWGEPSSQFKCIDGSGHGLPEDVKRPGWPELKEAYRTSNPNEEQREKRMWFETQASNCDPDGLGGREYRWSKVEVNQKLTKAGL